MAFLDDFVPLVRMEAQNVPIFTMRHAILMACREMCENSHIWKETLDPISLVADVEEYDIEQPNEARVLMLYSAQCRDKDLDFKTEQQMRGNWRTLTDTHPKILIQENPTTFRLVGIPTETVNEGITGLRAAVQPAIGATEVGDILMDEYAEMISYGALARLQRMPGKTWAQPELSQYYDGLFQGGIGNAKMRAWKGYGKSELHVQPIKLNGAP